MSRFLLTDEGRGGPCKEQKERSRQHKYGVHHYQLEDFGCRPVPRADAGFAQVPRPFPIALRRPVPMENRQYRSTSGSILGAIKQQFGKKRRIGTLARTSASTARPCSSPAPARVGLRHRRSACPTGRPVIMAVRSGIPEKGERGQASQRLARGRDAPGGSLGPRQHPELGRWAARTMASSSIGWS
jgi:hypothetical protein